LITIFPLGRRIVVLGAVVTVIGRPATVSEPKATWPIAPPHVL
jgi:hypothetical protein